MKLKHQGSTRVKRAQLQVPNFWSLADEGK
jgi:hypothetical protein